MSAQLSVYRDISIAHIFETQILLGLVLVVRICILALRVQSPIKVCTITKDIMNLVPRTIDTYQPKQS